MRNIYVKLSHTFFHIHEYIKWEKPNTFYNLGKYISYLRQIQEADRQAPMRNIYVKLSHTFFHIHEYQMGKRKYFLQDGQILFIVWTNIFHN